ncbi:MAG: DUF1992 domain-containing protein [Mobilicoccus sp.]|nr:DUF1992 domain-containing protein [Mobilicoccus sp.]
MSHGESWIDRQIREATERGEFSNLPGEGRPLDLSDVDDPDWWTKRFMAREKLDTSATMPPVLQLRAEHATFPESLAEVRREEDVREILADYNRRVVADRLRPVVGRAMPAVAPRVDVDAMVSRWRDLRTVRAEAEAQAAVEAPPTAPQPEPRRRWSPLTWWRRR